MATPSPESEPESDNKKFNRKLILLFTNQNEMIRLMAENNRILMEMFLYGEKE